jgi:hypothetical protein
MHGTGEKRVQGFGGKPEGERPLGGKGIDGGWDQIGP